MSGFETFMQSPVTRVVGLVVLAGLALFFVLPHLFRLGSGTGGTTGAPKAPQDPAGSMKPGGYKPPTKPTGDGSA